VSTQPQHLYTRGFTLLEVLVAMTILGLGVVTLLQIFSSGLRLGSRSSARTETMSSGARVMDNLLAQKKLPEGSQNGTLAAGGRWNSRVQMVRDTAPSLNLSSNWEIKEVALDMTVNEAGEERRLELKTLRLTKKSAQ
jgi:prepilin-type N-terminal cleavage/methylation domain-containing protein